MEPKPLSELLDQMLHEREEVRVRQAQTLREARKLHGLSQDEFAAAAGISQSYLSQVENGSRTISTDTLANMTQAFAAQSEGGTNAKGSSAKKDAAKARKRT